MTSTPFTDPFDTAHFTSNHFSVAATRSDPELDVAIFYRHFKPPASSSASRPILLLHGHPQTHVIWSTVAPALAATGAWEIVLPDNRGNGSSSAPPDRQDGVHYSRYSKREMARDMVELMQSLGHSRFWIVAHDRGARIAHRLALDWPESVAKMMLLDIAPTLDMYETTDVRFASAYWHWFFLLQPNLPEQFIAAHPQAYLDALVTRFPRTSPRPASTSTAPTPHASQLESWRTRHYLANLSSPSSISAMCQDYRASAPRDAPDLHLDRLDRERANKVKCQVKVLWGQKGVIELMYGGAVDMWAACCEVEVEGRAVECGHYIPEEAPEVVLEEIERFFCT